MGNGAAKAALARAEESVRGHAALGVSWRDPDKPLGARKAPPIPGVGLLGRLAQPFGYGGDLQNMAKGAQVKQEAVRAFPLLTAGRKLDEFVDPVQAIHAAYQALDVA
jgi:hypothetical protein